MSQVEAYTKYVFKTSGINVKRYKNEFLTKSQNYNRR